MLTHLHIRDLVIVRSVDLDFQPGMTVLTGETGAGKSILIDALGLALGDRADPSLIREGAAHAEITVVFDVGGLKDVTTWLDEQALDGDGECILRRVVARQGRSKGYINGRPVPIQSLQALGDLLINIHGQHAHQTLLHSDHQRQLLDDYGGQPDLVRTTATLYGRWSRTRRELQRLQQAARDRNARLELLRYQVEELDQLDLNPGEFEHLNEDYLRLANVERLQDICRRVVDLLYANDEASIHGLIGRCIDDMEPIVHLDQHLNTVCELLDSALIQVQEASGDLRHYGDNLESNPQALDALEKRLALIQDLARKHRVSPEALPSLHERLRQERADLENTEVQLENLSSEAAALETAYRETAQRLSQSRAQAARDLEEKVSAQIRGLSMPQGRFTVALESLDEDKLGATGLERVLFLVSANPGQPVQPLSKVASGGELSRISLAIQVVTARSGRIPTLIFDEVDVGIGGGVAEIVGRLLRTLGESRQVLCVTHLPQVAAQGHHHLQVQKYTEDNATHTSIRTLGQADRIAEIARMLGGIDITDRTVAHAKEMLELA